MQHDLPAGLEGPRARGWVIETGIFSHKEGRSSPDSHRPPARRLVPGRMPDDDYTYEIPGRPGAAAALYTQCESCYASCFAHTFNDHVVQLGCWDICCAERAASGLEVGSVSVGSAIGGASFIAGGATSTVAGYIPGASAVRPLQRDPSSPPAPPTYEPHRRRAGGWSRGDGRLAHVAHPKHAAVPGPAGGNLPLLPDGVHLFLHGGASRTGHFTPARHHAQPSPRRWPGMDAGTTAAPRRPHHPRRPTPLPTRRRPRRRRRRRRRRPRLLRFRPRRPRRRTARGITSTA